MDDLTQCLYEFVLDRRMKGLMEDERYRACCLAAELQEERVVSFLNDSQREELDQLLDQVMEQSNMEHAYLFQAALDLVQELDALGRRQVSPR